jgi:hypothetical protein
MRIVRTKSIPNVDNDRLLTDLGRLHDMFHTPEGLAVFDGPRRQLVDNGMKCLAIQRELTSRKVNTNIDCRWCGN